MPKLGSTLLRIALVALIVVAFALVWRERGEFQPAHLKELIAGNPYAPLIFIAIHIAASLLFVPRTPLSIAAGLMFGLWYGTLWAVLGAMAGSLAGFALARYVNAGWIRPDRLPKLGELLARVERGGWRAVALIRLVPIMPHTPVNYAFGLSRISLGNYLAGSLVGQLPITVFCVDVGSAGGQVLTGSLNWIEPTLVGVGALALSLVLPKLAASRRDQP
ncbi:hypothetical protein GCM10011611_32320 [Aliidongia dinghuensis]|uniref:TVP38/TMEM64 family membrane protein n=1 Tax=Aliidongia dinghuensis TaxID=1867774 RepID=A0A8J2YW73_9PROT|nr:TVP38/TMEM64 family protein [Aliidongia dinghuensis]GGF23745.1 hypothetical protein GCM10011611_32320 [Aliidongia dinghuensis]